RRAGRTARHLLHLGNRRPYRLRHPLDVKRLAACGGERLTPRLGLLGVFEDAEVEIETGRTIAFGDEHIPEGQRVLSPGHRYQDPSVAREHAVPVDGLADLLREELDEVRRAERCIVAPQLERGGPSALPALHRSPPDITGRTSRTSSPPTTVSLVKSSSPRITSTVPAKMSSSRSNSFTRRVPFTAISRRGLRRMTFIGAKRDRRSRAREPGRRLQGAELPQVVGIMVGLQLPPLRQIELTEPRVGPPERARVASVQPLDGLATAFARRGERADQLVKLVARLGTHGRRCLGSPR